MLARDTSLHLSVETGGLGESRMLSPVFGERFHMRLGEA